MDKSANDEMVSVIEMMSLKIKPTPTEARRIDDALHRLRYNPWAAEWKNRLRRIADDIRGMVKFSGDAMNGMSLWSAGIGHIAFLEELADGVPWPLQDARQEHIEMMVKAAADWLASDDSAYEIEPSAARRAAWGMLRAAFSIVPGPNVIKGPVDTRGAQDVR